MATTKFPIQLAAVVKETAIPVGTNTLITTLTLRVFSHKVVQDLPRTLRGNISLVTTHTTGLLWKMRFQMMADLHGQVTD